ncbi:hypothetical protein [Nostoc sphaeroides]|uniref:Uncharacterized protein n=1 Tax=Nostoc sphaeroides CCNUC1 TaxID=2653204 RepID=A0A5P8W010_9NOSO|nr:hypothetical protein [Nostoc sphaeroides]QFS46055.1 hypothetical protein GXM_03535 [Nostoc sphaeroides CCNUC1]
MGTNASTDSILWLNNLCESITKNLDNTDSINDCNTSLGKDAMNRVSTNGVFVAFFFEIGITSQKNQVF